MLDFEWKREGHLPRAVLSLFLSSDLRPLIFNLFIHLSPRWGQVGAPGGHALPVFQLCLWREAIPGRRTIWVFVRRPNVFQVILFHFPCIARTFCSAA